MILNRAWGISLSYDEVPIPIAQVATHDVDYPASICEITFFEGKHRSISKIKRRYDWRAVLSSGKCRDWEWLLKIGLIVLFYEVTLGFPHCHTFYVLRKLYRLPRNRIWSCLPHGQRQIYGFEDLASALSRDLVYSVWSVGGLDPGAVLAKFWISAGIGISKCPLDVILVVTFFIRHHNPERL